MEVYGKSEYGKLQVLVDVDLEDIIPGYLANRHKDLETVREALATGDYEKILVVGHSMKGSGGGYGFDSITEYGHALELGAKNKEDQAILEAAGKLRDYLDRVEVIYE